MKRAGLLHIAARVAAESVSGDAWDVRGPEEDRIEDHAVAAAEYVGRAKVNRALVSTFDRVFGSDYSGKKVPFTHGVDAIGTDELFHELLHHAFNPEKWVSYDSELEGALHEHAMREYQRGLGSSDSMSTAFMSLGIPESGSEMSAEASKAFVQAMEADVGMARDPKAAAILKRSLARVQALARKGGGVLDLEGLRRERKLLEKTAHGLSEDLIPEGLEVLVRRWYRELEIALRELEREQSRAEI